MKHKNNKWIVTLINSLAIVFPFVVGVLAEYLVGPGKMFFARRYSALTEFPLFRILILGVATLLGIFCGLLAEEVRIYKQQKQKPKDMIKRMWGKPRTVFALLLSPVIFHAVYIQVNSQPDTVIALLLAYQNGFFWQSVVETVKHSQTRLE